MANSRWLNRILISLLGISFLFRFLLTLFRRFNADEFQHLHASWMVHLGFTPYVDFWENHSPLLYFLTAPLLSLFADGPQTALVLRFLHSAAGLAIAAIVYKIARLDHDRTTALLSVVILSLSEIYIQKSIEVRTDQFLVLFWLFSLWFCFRALHSSKTLHLWIAGLCLGIAMLFSPKALVCYIAAGGIIFSAAISRPARALKMQVIFLSGFLAPCLALAVYFYSRGLLEVLIESTILQNLTYPDTRGPSFLLLPQNLALLLLGTAGMALSYSDRPFFRSAEYKTPSLLMIAALVPAAILIFFMPSAFSQSALTFVPIFSIYAAVAVRRSLQWKTQLKTRQAVFLSFTLLAAFFIPVASLLIRASQDETNVKQMELLRYVLENTSPDEAIFDGNSAYIFRKQAYFYGSLVEGIRYKIESGQIQESIIESLSRNRCRMVLYDDRVSDLPQEVQNFIRSNYLPTNQENVFTAGQTLDADDISGNEALFRIEIPLVYSIQSQSGGTLRIDNQPYTSSVLLERGMHRLISDKALRGVQIRAVRR
jgi:hypothetical protein